MAEQLITYADVAQLLGVRVRAVKRMVQSRALPVVKLSPRRHRFRLSEVEAAIRKVSVRAVG